MFKRLPCKVFSSKTLSVLKVRGIFFLELPKSAFLPCLKTVHLFHVWFDPDIFSICPVLEDLYIYSCDFSSYDLLISHPILRKLKIKEFVNDYYELVLNTPSLVSFEHKASAPGKVSVETALKSLDKACLVSDKELYPFDIDVDATLNLVAGVSYARDLHLSKVAIEAFQGRS